MKKLVTIHYRAKQTALRLDGSWLGGWVQSEPTWIVLGWRSTHMYNCELKEWFRVSNACPPHALERPGTRVDRMPFSVFARQVGFWRAALEVFEVACGFRVIGRLLDWRKPVPEDMADFEPPRIRGD